MPFSSAALASPRPRRALAVPGSAVCSRLARDSGFGQAWANHLANELLLTRRRAEMRSLRTIRERFDARVMLVGGELPKRGKWKNVANGIGTNPEALYRELAERRKET